MCNCNASYGSLLTAVTAKSICMSDELVRQNVIPVASLMATANHGCAASSCLACGNDTADEIVFIFSIFVDK